MNRPLASWNHLLILIQVFGSHFHQRSLYNILHDINVFCKGLKTNFCTSFACPESLALSKPLLGDGPKLAWGDSETRALISVWGNNQIQERLRCCVKRKPVFQQIATAMAEKGYSRTDEQCRTRIKRLKASYRQCLDSPR